MSRITRDLSKQFFVDDSSCFSYTDHRSLQKFKKKGSPLEGPGGSLMMPGPWELILILLIVVMVFGAKRIPEIMGGLGKGIKSFKKSMEVDDQPSDASQGGSIERPREKNELKEK